MLLLECTLEVWSIRLQKLLHCTVHSEFPLNHCLEFNCVKDCPWSVAERVKVLRAVNSNSSDFYPKQLRQNLNTTSSYLRPESKVTALSCPLFLWVLAPSMLNRPKYPRHLRTLYTLIRDELNNTVVKNAPVRCKNRARGQR